MTETPFYFPNGAYALFGMLHQPQVASDRPALVFCHAFAEEKLWTHRVFVTFARRLAAGGYPVLRFDLMGNGDSGGDFSASSLTTALSDVRCAIEEVRRRTNRTRVSLLGLRTGATLAALISEAVDGVEDLILWAPIVDGARYMQEMLRTNLTTQMAVYKEVRHDREQLIAAMKDGARVNIDGYEMAFPLYSEFSAIKLNVDPKRHQGRCLIVQIDRTPDAEPTPEIQQLARTYARPTVLTVQEEPFWKEIQRFYNDAPNLFPATLNWLQQQ